MAKGALAGLDEEIDRMIKSIYEKREKETSRRVLQSAQVYGKLKAKLDRVESNKH